MNSFIEHLLTQPEGKTLEFKRDLSSPRNLLKTLVAFANSAGGVVLIGVADDRTVIGLEQPLDDEERLDNLIGDAIAPRLVPNVEILSWQDRSILAVEVFPGSNRPYYLKSEGQPDGVYVRLGSSNRQAGSAAAARPDWSTGHGSTSAAWWPRSCTHSSPSSRLPAMTCS